MAVGSWGMGRPDFYQLTAPAKAVVGKDQEYEVKWTDLETCTLAAGVCGAIDAYTVPLEYDLHLGGGVISCNQSGIQNVRLVHTPGILGDFRYDMRGDLILTEQSAHILEAEDILSYYVFNNLSVVASFSIALTGFLHRVGE